MKTVIENKTWSKYRACYLERYLRRNRFIQITGICNNSPVSRKSYAVWGNTNKILSVYINSVDLYYGVIMT